MKFGIDRLLSEPALRAPLKGRRVALLAVTLARAGKAPSE